MTGKVYLIGMGPGDSDLITMKAIKALQECDILIYDRLINKDLLRYNDKAEKIYVGKASGDHALPQDQINELLVEKAKEGLIVGRLKGGDPFVFGRGGEEALFLKENGVEYDIVPGITSSIAVPMYSAIPVTYRGIATSFHVITGHEQSEEGNIDWNALARVNGTLVFLMGLENIELIVNNLIANGKSKDCPAAVIMNGTRYNQREVYGSLEDIKEKCDKARIKSPAIIVVGDVVKIHELIDWRHKGNLSGLKIAITRPIERADGIIKLLKQNGAIPVSLPCIHIKEKECDLTKFEIDKYKHIIFSSVYGVKHFYENMIKNRIDLRRLRANIIGVGPSVKAELEKIGIFQCEIPDQYNSGEILKYLIPKLEDNDRILVVTGNIGGEKVIEGLSNYKVDRALVYETYEGCDYTVDADIEAIFFTSPSCVRGFIKEHDINIFSSKLAVCIGDSTSRQAESAGFSNIKVLSNSIPELVIDELIKWRKENVKLS